MITSNSGGRLWECSLALALKIGSEDLRHLLSAEEIAIHSFGHRTFTHDPTILHFTKVPLDHNVCLYRAWTQRRNYPTYIISAVCMQPRGDRRVLLEVAGLGVEIVPDGVESHVGEGCDDDHTGRPSLQQRCCSSRLPTACPGLEQRHHQTQEASCWRQRKRAQRRRPGSILKVGAFGICKESAWNPCTTTSHSANSGVGVCNAEAIVDGA
jgi:hypothetical protein